MIEKPDKTVLEDDILLDQWLKKRQIERNLEERRARLNDSGPSTFGDKNIHETFEF